MSAFVDLYHALWNATLDRYAKRKDSPGQLSLFGHDVEDEPRDPQGRWTTGGNSAKSSPPDGDHAAETPTLTNEQADNGSAGTEPKAEDQVMSLAQQMIDQAREQHAQWPGQGWDTVASTIEGLDDTEKAKVEAYLAGGDFKNRSKKLASRIRGGTTPIVPMTESEQKAAADAEQRSKAEKAEQERQAAVAREEKRKADLAAKPLQQRAEGEVGWRTDKRGRRIYVTGTRYGDPKVELLRSLGATWDAQEKAWWVGSGKAAELERIIQDVNGRKQAGQAEAHRRQAEGLAISIPYEHTAIREQAKRLGARWDGVKKQWLMPNQDSHRQITEALSEKRMQAIRDSERDKMRREQASQAAKMPAGGRMFSKTTDLRGQGYGVGARIRDKEGKLWIVTAVEKPERFEDGLSFGMGRDDGYQHTAYARPATEQEDAESQKATRIAQLENEVRILGVGPDDDRDREAHSQRLTAALAELKQLRAQ